MHKIPKPCNRLIPVFGRILIGRLGELIVGFVGQSLGGKSGDKRHQQNCSSHE